jgi:hypothetical protein
MLNDLVWLKTLCGRGFSPDPSLLHGYQAQGMARCLGKMIGTCFWPKSLQRVSKKNEAAVKL